MEGSATTQQALREAVSRIRRGMEIREFRMQLSSSKIIDSMLLAVTEGGDKLREEAESVVALFHDLVTL